MAAGVKRSYAAWLARPMPCSPLKLAPKSSTASFRTSSRRASTRLGSVLVALLAALRGAGHALECREVLTGFGFEGAEQFQHGIFVAGNEQGDGGLPGARLHLQSGCGDDAECAATAYE